MSLTCDTSVLLPALVAWHDDHTTARRALPEVRAVPAHALIECYSVLTRLPHGQRVAPATAAAVLDGLEWSPLTLSAEEHLELIARCAAVGVSGGATYDALIGATAQRFGMTLLTRDKRACMTYDALGIAYTVV